ncbi:MAG: metallophosphoesterase [Deltaproteobacteria bacterium]|nr:metallophosphoesterase [Deltaproteobacteria bacterium]
MKSLRLFRALTVLVMLLIVLRVVAAIMPSAQFGEQFHPAQTPAAPLFDRSQAVESVLIGGDGGRMHRRMGTAMASWLERSPRQRSALFLGDNIYPAGMPDPSQAREYERAEESLRRHILPLKPLGVNFLFIPGNHDWDFEGEMGFDRILRQQEWLNRELGPGHFSPKGGCGGPGLVKLTDHVQALVFDTQWWLHQAQRGESKEAGCEASTPEEMRELVNRHLSATPSNVITIVSTHHPFRTYGRHGRSTRCPSGSLCPENKQMVAELSAMVEPFNPLICAGGHDHGLQLIDGGERGCRYYVVSGAISDTTSVSYDEGTLYASDLRGFMMLDRTRDGAFYLSIITVQLTGDSQYHDQVEFSLAISK